MTNEEYCAAYNMYGMTACPRCGDKHRWTRNTAPRLVLCDACGHEESLTEQNCSPDYWENYAPR